MPDPQQVERDEQRVTIGRRSRHRLSRYHAAGTVIDYHLLAPDAGEFLCKKTCSKVPAAAGTAGDDTRRLERKILAGRCRRAK